MPIFKFDDFAKIINNGNKIVPKLNDKISIEVDRNYLYINQMAFPTGCAGDTGMVLMGSHTGMYWDVIPTIGSTGIQGPTGAFGGPPGATGLQGQTGLRGPAGINGTNGLTGIQGQTGLRGITGLYTIHEASANPTYMNNRDTYWDTEEEALYLKIENQWVQISAASQKGSTGTQGPTGAFGGPQGETGLSLAGATGLQGATGLPGSTGAQGVTGLRGLTGAGIQGTTGLIGPTGAFGGPQGATGLQGATGPVIVRYSFLAYNSQTRADVTGDGTVVSPVLFDSEVFDTGSCFTGSTFTCPVTGKYSFNVQIVSLGGGVRLHESILVTTKRNYVFSTQGQQVTSINVSVIADMDQNDIAFVFFKVSGTTKTVDIIGNGASDLYTFFSGSLVE